MRVLRWKYCNLCKDMEKEDTLKIGNTSLIELTRLRQQTGALAHVFGKAEYENAGGSIKDRVALAIIQDAEEKGTLTKGGTIVEATSGNTGIGLALVAKQKGYRAIIFMPSTMSKERQDMIRKYGGEVVLTDGAKGMQGAVEQANAFVNNTPNCVLAGQFDNPVCVDAHYKTTAPEIDCAIQGQVDVIVAGVGTGGTLTGIGKYFKEKNPQTYVVAVEPSASPLLSKGVAGAHGIQGIGANFIPSILDRTIYDEVQTVTEEDALFWAKLMRKEENAFVGISSGAAVCVAMRLATRKEYAGKNVVVILPDSADRYLSVKNFL